MDEETKNVFSEKIRSGNKTYFFDIKATRANNSYYLVISKSRKVYDEKGSVSFNKSKLFIYPEDVHDFVDALDHTVTKLKELLPKEAFRHQKKSKYKYKYRYKFKFKN